MIHYFQLSINLTFALKYNHLMEIILIVLCLFISSFILVSRRTHRKKVIHLHFRKITLRYFPLNLRISLLDILRTGHAFFIILTVTVCSLLFQTTQFVVENWLKSSESLYIYEDDITANFDLFQKDEKNLTSFLSSVEDICSTNYAKKCTIQYNVASELSYGNQIIPSYSLSVTAFTQFAQAHNIDPTTDKAILIHKDESLNRAIMIIKILNKWHSIRIYASDRYRTFRK